MAVSTGRFGVQDSYLGQMTDPLSLNRYLYCLSDPLNLIDPSGHWGLGVSSAFNLNAIGRTIVQAFGPRYPQLSATVPLVPEVTPELARETTNYALSLWYAKHGNGIGGSSGSSSAAYYAARAEYYRQQVFKISCGISEYVASQKASQASSSTSWLHTGLDLLGMLPGIGAAFDVANGVLYLAEGDYGEAALSFLSAIPGYGDAISGLNTARKLATAAMGAAGGAATIKGASGVFAALHFGSRPSVSTGAKTIDGVTDGKSLETSEMLQKGIDWLGGAGNYVEKSPGRFVSSDGTRQFRITDGDIAGTHAGGPHANFEIFSPVEGKPGRFTREENLHVFFVD